MGYPMINEIERSEDTSTVFGGYNHTLLCRNGEFYDMQNMSAEYYPVLSPRKRRGYVKNLTCPQGIIDKDDLYWIDSGKIYSNGVAVDMQGITLSEGDKSLCSIGAFLVIMPDKVYYNTSTGEIGMMDNHSTTASGFSLGLASEDGQSITAHPASYYETNEPKGGNYMLDNGTLSVYSVATKTWTSVVSPYVKISRSGIGKGLKDGDGVKITVDYNPCITAQSYEDMSTLKDLFINQESKNILSNNFVIKKATDDYVIVGGLTTHIANRTTISYSLTTIRADRDVPDMSFMTECQNRLWGCSTDGHEIYCCKLGDITNWNCFSGISTDSWAVTIGSDGIFTGAITFLGYPMFFKEDCFVKISVSALGAHQTKETACRGLQSGSHKSLCILNDLLIYKSMSGICTYSGSLPVSISDALGEERFYEAVGGTIDDRYYISMRDANGKWHMFVYHSDVKMFTKEDNTKVYDFIRYDDKLYFIDAEDMIMKSIDGTFLYEGESHLEEKLSWMCESGSITYDIADNKYVSRMNVRITLQAGSSADFYIKYEDGEYQRLFSIFGNGKRMHTVPIVPQRCDHFSYKIVGHGDAKVHSITKSIERGSDFYG